MAHTPGPWVMHQGPYDEMLDAFPVIGGDGFRVVEAGNSEKCHRKAAEHKANACLIAAGPELLEALKALLKVCDEELDPKRTPEMREARIAIAKANGAK